MCAVFFNLIPSWLIQLLFRSFEARDVFISQVKDLRKQYPDRPIAFATYNGGVVEYLAIRLFLQEEFKKDFELRLATRINMFFVEPFSNIFRRIASLFGLMARSRSRIRMCSEESMKGHPILLNFEVNERRKAFQTSLGEIELAYLAEQNPHLLIVPTVFVWRRKKRPEEDLNQKFSSKLWKNFVSPISSPWNLLLGDPYQPTGFRKFLIMLRQYSRSTLRLSQPINVTDHPSKSLRRRILVTIQQEKRVVLGSNYRSSKLIGESILRSPSFLSLARTLAAEEGVPELTIFKRAQKIFDELSSNFSYFIIEVTGWVLHIVFTTIFTDVTVKDEDFEKLRVASKEGPLLFIPSHKSYVDFLILSYVLFRKDLLPPHIAAGLNLNFWPVGRIFKGGGAFFIRRSFRGNILYQEVLRRYIAELFQNKLNVEFFIEGQRSRSGKLAPPKFGMLKMIVDSKYDGLITEKISIIPVSICYDRVTEEGAHKRELEGGEKVQETAAGLLKAVKVLAKNFGRVHLRCADPISLNSLTDQFIGDGSKSIDTKKLGVQKIAFEVCHQINRVTPVTSFGLVCGFILSRPGAAVARDDLVTLLNHVLGDIQKLGILMAPDLEANFESTIKNAIDRLLKDGILLRYDTAAATEGIKIPDKQRLAALFYKNTMIHAFLVPAIKGLSKGYNDRILELRTLLQFEFFFAEKDAFLKQVTEIPDSALTDLYAFLLDDVLENICVGLRGLIKMQGLFIEPKEWKTRLMKFGRAAIQESSVNRIEGVNTQSFVAFVEMAQNKGWLKSSPNQSQLFTPASTAELTETLDKVKRLRVISDDWDKICEKYPDSKTAKNNSVERI
jgi:1-acyl-sn-glycerol-3-phosphate acyltransferase